MTSKEQQSLSSQPHNQETLTEDNNIEIHVATKYVANQSSESNKRFAFAYTITIKNSGADTAQLISRSWLVNDANEKTHQVEGDGVVGKQPVLEPGKQFSYTSGTVLSTPVGSMQGYYLMKKSDGEEFKVRIPPFRLADLSKLH